MSRFLRAPAVWAALTGIALVSACQDLTDPLDTTPTDGRDTTEVIQFSEDMSVSKTSDVMSSKSARVNVMLVDGEGLVAGQVVFEWPNLQMDDEVVRSAIIAMDEEAETITLAAGDMVIDFSAAEEFLESNESALTREAFIEAVRTALDNDEEPGVHVQRPAPGTPQDPEDATFMASSLRLDEVDANVLELNVDRDNLARNDAPPPAGWLTVLGLAIELRVTEGITQIRVERPDLDVRRFSGTVTGVDLDARTFTIDDGTVIEVRDRTRLAPYFWAGHRRLRTLESVQDAIDAGFDVSARGRGVVTSESPLTLVAIHVRFRLDRVHFEKFRGEVTAVDVEASTVTLADETVVQFTDHSVIFIERGKPRKGSLEGVAEALEAGQAVTVKGFGFSNGADGSPIYAVFAWFMVSDANVRVFSGAVTSVDLESSSFVVGEELTVLVTEDTDIRMYHHDVHGLRSLEAVQRAIQAGFDVVAEGAGIPNEEAETPTITALEVRFELHLEDPIRFEGMVTGVDVEAGTATLDDGTVIGITEVTRLGASIDKHHDAITLEFIARVLEAELPVSAHGKGMLVNEDPRTILALTVEFRVDWSAVREFKGIVREVDLENNIVVLDDDVVIHLVEGTEVAFGEGLESLEDVANAVTAGEIDVRASGKGVLREGDGQATTLIALSVRFTID